MNFKGLVESEDRKSYNHLDSMLLSLLSSPLKKIDKFKRELNRFGHNSVLEWTSKLDFDYFENQEARKENVAYLLQLAWLACEAPAYRSICAISELQNLIQSLKDMSFPQFDIKKLEKELQDAHDKNKVEYQLNFIDRLLSGMKHGSLGSEIKKNSRFSIILRLQHDHRNQYLLSYFFTELAIFHKLASTCLEIERKFKEENKVTYKDVGGLIIEMTGACPEDDYFKFQAFFQEKIDIPFVRRYLLTTPEELKRKLIENLGKRKEPSDVLALYLSNPMFVRPFIETKISGHAKKIIVHKTCFLKSIDLFWDEFLKENHKELFKKRAEKSGESLNIMESYILELLNFYCCEKKNAEWISEALSEVKTTKSADFMLSKGTYKILIESKASACGIDDLKTLDPNGLIEFLLRAYRAFQQCVETLGVSEHDKAIAIICVNQELFVESNLFKTVIHSLKVEHKFLAIELLSITDLDILFNEFSFDEVFESAIERWAGESHGQDLILHMRECRKALIREKNEGLCTDFQRKNLESIYPHLKDEFLALKN